MLHKFFGVRSSRVQVPNPSPAPPPDPTEERSRSSALKIMHAGGFIEYYYMAVPARRIMEKYPSFVLASPDVFRRPWDAVVPPEKILIPGEKYFVVARRTVKKLRRRIRRHSGEISVNSFVSQPSSDASAEIASHTREDFSSNSCVKKSGVNISSICCTAIAKGKIKVQRRVRFIGTDSKSDSNSFSIEKKGNSEENKNGLKPELGRRNRRVRKIVTWQPNLTAVDESHAS